MSELHLHNHEGHSHSHADGYSSQRRIGIAALITFMFMFAEIAGGLISGSLALLADAAHMLTDAGSLALAFVGYMLARKPADLNRTFGFSRFKVLAAFTNGLLLLALGGWIVAEAAHRMISPEPVLSGIMFWVAVAGLIINIVMFSMLHSGHDHNDVNMSGAVAHVLGDLMGSVAAIVAAIVIWLTGWTMIDPILSVLVAGLLFWSAIPIIRKSSHILLQGTPKGIDLPEIATGLKESLPSIQAVHHIHAWTLTGEDRLLTMHVVPHERVNAIHLIPEVRQVLKQKFGIDHATIELDLEPLDRCEMHVCDDEADHGHEYDHHDHSGHDHDHDETHHESEKLQTP